MPREQLFQRKVPVMLTDDQVEWLDEYRWAHRFEGRSEAIRALIDSAREQQDGGASLAPLEEPGPAITPYSVEAYPGQGFAPLIVPFLIRTARRHYSEDELVEASRLQIGTAQPGQLASIRITMRASGFVPETKKLPGQARVNGWRAR